MEKMPFEGAPEGNQKAHEEFDDITDNHSANLYDQNEDAAGEVVDLATGKKINNSGNVVIGGKLSRVEAGTTDALPDLKEEEDAAAKWLRENDPNYKK